MRPQLKLRPIGIRDYSVREGPQRIGRIRFAAERNPGIWIWHVQVHLTGGLPMGSCQRSRNREGGIQSGLGNVEGQDAAGSDGGGVQGDEYS